MLSSLKKYYSVVTKTSIFDIAGSRAAAPEAEQFLSKYLARINFLRSNVTHSQVALMTVSILYVSKGFDIILI